MRGTAARAITVVWLLVACLGVSGTASPTHADPVRAYKGLPLASALSRLQQLGLRLVFSSDTVLPGMVVREEPRAQSPRDILDELLAPHGLRATPGPAGTLLIVSERRSQSRPKSAAPGQPGRPVTGSPRVHSENVVVIGDSARARTGQPEQRELLGRHQLQTSPDPGADPFSSVARLAGIATAEGSGALHARGGASHETEIILDGLELYEPYHLKDRGSPISIISADTLGSVGVLNGAFPAEHGGHLSGVLEMATVVPDPGRHGQIVVSADDVQIATSGRIRDRLGWVVAGRRGDTSRLLAALGADPSYHPAYRDMSARADYQLTGRTALSFNLLGGDDDVEKGAQDEGIDTVHEPGTFRAQHTNSYGWITVQRAWTTSLFSRTVLSMARVFDERNGSRPGVAFVQDERRLGILGIKQDWLKQSTNHLLKWGVDLKQLRAEYDYASSRAPDGITRRPRGVDAGLYAADRFSVSPRLNLEMGLRWDEQTYGPGRTRAVAPRINAAYALGEGTSLRAGWGRFSQPQKIHELQVEDGVADYQSLEWAEHRMLSLVHDLGSVTTRISVYQKRMTTLRARYENLFEPLGFFPEAATDRVRVAPDAGRSDGIEVAVRSSGRERTSWWAEYSLARAEDRIDGSWVPRSWDQRHGLALGAEWAPASGWAMSAVGSFHSGRPTTPVTAGLDPSIDDSASVVPHIGARNSQRLAGYSRVDLRVSRSMPLGRSRVTGVLTLTNALDRDNVCCVVGFNYLPQADGSVSVQRRERQGLPRQVTLGAAWRF